MEAFLTILLVFVIFIWLLSRFGPMLFTWWIKRRVEKLSGRVNDNYKREDYKEGDTIVSMDQGKEKVVDPNVGEYVEFTESQEEKS